MTYGFQSDKNQDWYLFLFFLFYYYPFFFFTKEEIIKKFINHYTTPLFIMMGRYAYILQIKFI